MPSDLAKILNEQGDLIDRLWMQNAHLRKMIAKNERKARKHLVEQLGTGPGTQPVRTG